MTVALRVVLDQIVAPNDPNLAMASRELARALISTAPDGCAVEGIVPTAADVAATVEAAVPGLADLTRVGLARRELAAAWQLGVAPTSASGMIHSPTLLAPLVKHDRLHAHDQTVITLWDLDAWERPEELARGAVTWHRSMLKRAAKHADAIVVPTHAAAAALAELGTFGDRVRVIAGAAPEGFVAPVDQVGRRRELAVAEGSIVVSGSSAPSAGLSEAFGAIVRTGQQHPIVILDVPEGDEPAVVELAVAAGIPEAHVHVRGALDDPDRAAVLASALAFLAPSRLSRFPWRVVEALVLGVPVVAPATPTLREVIVDGGVLVESAEASGYECRDALADGLSEVIAAPRRYAVLAADRGRAFSWAGAAERVWQLHADL